MTLFGTRPPMHSLLRCSLEDYVFNYFKIRRLHLIVVDTWRPWRYNANQLRAVTDQMAFMLHECPERRRAVPMMPTFPPDAAGLFMAMLWITLSFHATFCGPAGTVAGTASWIPRRMTHWSSLLTRSFGRLACNTSMIPLLCMGCLEAIKRDGGTTVSVGAPSLISV